MCLFCRTFFDLFHLAIVLSVLLRLMTSDDLFGLSNLFFLPPYIRLNNWTQHNIYDIDGSLGRYYRVNWFTIIFFLPKLIRKKFYSTVGISIIANCAPVLAELLFHSYEIILVKRFHQEKRKETNTLKTKIYNIKGDFNFLIMKFSLYVSAFQQPLYKGHICLSWFDIPELILIRVSWSEMVMSMFLSS